MNVFVVGVLPASLINFRGNLLDKLSSSGCKVTAMASAVEGEVVSELKKIDVEFISFPVQRNGLNPIVDLTTWGVLRKIFRKMQPDVVLAYTIKPIIWGGLASRVVPKIRFYALITGLGFAFHAKGPVRKILTIIVTMLYRVSLLHAETVIFQNSDNLNEFISRKIVPASKCALVNGSGVDLQQYEFTPIPGGEVTFLTIGRLLGEKGFREYALAAKLVKEKYPNVVFQLLGPKDPSPDGIMIDEILGWDKEGWIKYLGSTKDVRPYINNCHVYVLPSYHEGLPRTVLEAMAIGRPILTTDVPGCKETVISGQNGYLVPKENVKALAKSMIWFIENKGQWESMGRCSRKIAEDRFDVENVNMQLVKIMGLDNETPN